MRTIVGGLVGLALASALVAGTGIWNPAAMWPIALAGAVAGLVMRGAASGEGSPYARGGVAGVVTALAAVLGPLLATQIIQSEILTGAKEPPPSLAMTDEATPEPDAGGNAVAVAEPTRAEETIVIGSGGGVPTKAPDPFQPMPVAMLVVGCLLAYQIGKGPGPATTLDEDSESGEGDQPPAAEAAGDDGQPADAEQQPAGA